MYSGPPATSGPCSKPVGCCRASASSGSSWPRLVDRVGSDGSRKSTTPSGWRTEITPSGPTSSVLKNCAVRLGQHRRHHDAVERAVGRRQRPADRDDELTGRAGRRNGRSRTSAFDAAGGEPLEDVAVARATVRRCGAMRRVRDRAGAVGHADRAVLRQRRLGGREDRVPVVVRARRVRRRAGRAPRAAAGRRRRT